MVPGAPAPKGFQLKMMPLLTSVDSKHHRNISSSYVDHRVFFVCTGLVNVKELSAALDSFVPLS